MEAELLAQLECEGIVRLPELVTGEQLAGMQRAFESRLHRMRWNDVDGYERTELYRHMVQDILTLDQGFVDVALHPMVKRLVRAYLGSRFQLVEAKGWKSLPTRKDFHGWHGDAWYDQSGAQEIPRELKLGFYLTDVKSGAFHYIGGSHRKQHPRPVRASELRDVPETLIAAVTGPAGSAFLFDTSGIHRQGAPILEPRQAVFYDYHDPEVPLDREHRDYNRYHPLLLNAAFLGSLSEEDQRILGFGNTSRHIPAFERRSPYQDLQRLFHAVFGARLRADSVGERISGRVRRILRRG